MNNLPAPHRPKLSLAEFGADVRSSPTFINNASASWQSLSDEQVALRVLQKHPSGWEFITPAVRRIHSILERDFQGGGFFESTRLSNTQEHMRNAISEGVTLHELSLIAGATARHLPRSVYEEVISLPHKLAGERQKDVLDRQRNIFASQLRIDELAATKLVEYDFHERVENLRLRHTIELEAARNRILSDLENDRLDRELRKNQAQTDSDLDAAERVERDQLARVDELLATLSRHRDESEAVRTAEYLSAEVRDGRLKDLALAIGRLEAKLEDA